MAIAGSRQHSGARGGEQQALRLPQFVRPGLFMTLTPSSSKTSKQDSLARAIDSAAPTLPRALSSRTTTHPISSDSAPTIPTAHEPLGFMTPAMGLEWDDDGPPTEKMQGNDTIALEDTVLVARDMLVEHTLPLDTSFLSTMMPEWLAKNAPPACQSPKETLPPQWRPSAMPNWLLTTAPTRPAASPFRKMYS